MRTALLVAFIALALQPSGPTRGAGDGHESGFAPSSELAQPPLVSPEYCGRIAPPSNLTAQVAVLEDDVQLVLQGDQGTTPADF